MPVNIHPAPNFDARKWVGSTVSSPEALLKGACPYDHRNCKTIIQSSFDIDHDNPIAPLKNGFVYAAIEAYSWHHHLILRPEDIWFAILTQLSLYINAHAEKLRSFFVPHKGQEQLWINYPSENINTIDMGKFARDMSGLLSKNVNDPDLHPWIMPAFSTTTDNDRVVASVIMMGALQKYFSYGCRTGCALPSVTLLGERSDCEIILQRLEKLPQLGEEPTIFYGLLKPVVGRFVQSFTSPTTEDTRDFWQKIVHKNSGSGVKYISGWITAFCMWREDGRCLYRADGRNVGCRLAQTIYHRVDIGSIPSSCTSVPVTVDDFGKIYKTVMVAGCVGVRVTSSGNMLDETAQSHSHGKRWDAMGTVVPRLYPTSTPTGQPDFDSLQPESGWWMYDTGEEPASEEGRGEAVLQGPEPQAHSTKSAFDNERTTQVEVNQRWAQKVASRISRLSRLLCLS